MSNSLRPYGPWPTRFLCSQGFSRQEYWSGLPCPLPGELPDPGFKLESLSLLHRQAVSSPLAPLEKPHRQSYYLLIGQFYFFLFNLDIHSFGLPSFFCFLPYCLPVTITSSVILNSIAEIGHSCLFSNRRRKAFILILLSVM